MPARLDASATAVVLGFGVEDIPILVHAKMLRPLGNPAPNAPKYFASNSVLECAGKLEWLNKATRVVTDRWRRKNAKLHLERDMDGPTDGAASGDTVQAPPGKLAA